MISEKERPLGEVVQGDSLREVGLRMGLEWQ